MLALLHSYALVAAGAWLLLYKFAMLTPLGVAVPSTMTTAIAGLPMALLSPLFPWPPEPFQWVTLAILGVLLSFLHPVLTALVLSIALGFGAGGFVWQNNLCEALPEVAGWGMHGPLMWLTVLLSIIIFLFVPGFSGPQAVVGVLVPCTGALLLVLGVAGVGTDYELIRPDALLAVEPCRAHSPPVVHSLLCWFGVAFLGMLSQFLINRYGRPLVEEEEDEIRDGMVASLLPVGEKEEGGGASLPRPGQVPDGENRFRLLTAAIYADEGTDQAHLTENERKLVAVCRKDEFERDRVIWGGGLI